MDEMSNYQRDILNAAMAELPWEKISGKNILVTGATGLVGGAVVEVLMSRPEIDFHVYASGRNKERFEKRFEKYKDSECLHFLQYDVTRPLEGNIDFHFMIDAASGANPKEYATNPVGVMKANIYGVDNLLTYGKKHHLEKFVFVSSGEVYGEGDGRVFTEEYSGYVDCTSPRSCYPSSKRASETLCVSYAVQYGINVSIARLTHVYGPHFTESDTRVYAQFIRNVLNNEDIVMKSTGEQFRSWSYVVDCASALLYILLKGENGEAYNVADEKSNISIRELAETIAVIGGKKVVIDLPDDAERRGYNVVTKSVFSTDKVVKLGWFPVTHLNEGIMNTISEIESNYR